MKQLPPWAESKLHSSRRMTFSRAHLGSSKGNGALYKQLALVSSDLAALGGPFIIYPLRA